MKLHMESAEIYVPDGTPVEAALARTTHLAVGAHADDIEVMAYHGIAQCYRSSEKHFTGVTVTDGAGSPRAGDYARRTDEEMRDIRRAEQIKAASIGEYCAQVMLDYPSSAFKNSADARLVDDLKQIITSTRPDVVYTHNLADRHDTHVAVALRVLSAIRQLPNGARPGKLLGCEVWRGLDWLADEDKVALNVESHPEVAAALLEAFDSQIAGGKRYDLAELARRRANATYFASHEVDTAAALTFAMDLTPLVEDDSLDPVEYVQKLIKRVAEDATHRISRLS